MALTLESGLRELPGIGDARAARLAKLGLATVENLLGYYPRSYEDRTKISTIDGAPEEQPVCVAAFVAETPRVSHIRKGLELVKVKVADETAVMTVTFFNQAYVRDALRQGRATSSTAKWSGRAGSGR